MTLWFSFSLLMEVGCYPMRGMAALRLITKVVTKERIIIKIDNISKSVIIITPFFKKSEAVLLFIMSGKR